MPQPSHLKRLPAYLASGVAQTTQGFLPTVHRPNDGCHRSHDLFLDIRIATHDLVLDTTAVGEIGEHSQSRFFGFVRGLVIVERKLLRMDEAEFRTRHT